MYTYSLQEDHFLHLDFDVFLFSKLPDFIEQADVFAQSRERFSNRYFYTEGVVLEELPYYKWVDPRPLKEREATNVGIVGGKNTSFIREYAKDAMTLTTHPENKELHSNYSREDWARITVTQEQYFLNLKAYLESVEITYLFDLDLQDEVTPEYVNIQEDYIHLMDKKYNARYSRALRDYLEENYNEYYRRVNNLDLHNWKNTFS